MIQKYLPPEALSLFLEFGFVTHVKLWKGNVVLYSRHFTLFHLVFESDSYSTNMETW